MNGTRCPDCGIETEATSLRTNGAERLVVDTGSRGGVLGKLGVGKTAGVDAVCCPECGLLRLYADLDGD
ncbi:hypothetical protein [Halosolutus gelatinilyticus]|uniref:hypothetical protein n=1 Tax=Halosolutus gelatinilyticus TaxID=2931975 RepID=UPI001FF276CA|nr:hypothetical protein [Halosolutus gelatinilyticus]